MAVFDERAAGAALDDVHFASKEFDDLLRVNGSPAQLRVAMQCPCLDPKTGKADAACTNCFPFGVLWDPPIDVHCFGPDRKPLRRPDAAGVYHEGDAFFTFPTGVIPTPLSRLLLPLSEITVHDVLRKGHEDTLRFTEVVNVEKAAYSRRVPPTGHPYAVQVVPLVLGADISVDGREVTWHTDDVADGTMYVVRARVRVEYLVIEPQDRNEGGLPLPYRYHCRRLEYLLHPRGQKAVSY